MSNPTATLNFPVPSALGTIDQYVTAVNKYPLLTPEQEQELGLRWKYMQDVDSARQLVMSHLRLVVSVSRNYMGYGLPQGDLIQEGNVGLMKAVRRFDPERGVRLVSFALHWIRAEIHEYILKNWRLVKVATTKAQRKLFFNLRAMRSGEHPLTQAEAKRIAKELNVKPEEVFEMNMRLSGRDIAMDGTPDDSESEAVAPVAYLAADSDVADPAKVIEAEEVGRVHSEGLKRALVKLDDRSRDIITRRWLAEDQEETL
ncbi:MAG TPA: RNA polymerase sigma factor RpoH, partial [Casimicrobium huifangae]|nr:RNA polymerase sigma factor RpoH [Casimicrobium huifangae]